MGRTIRDLVAGSLFGRPVIEVDGGAGRRPLTADEIVNVAHVVVSELEHAASTAVVSQAELFRLLSVVSFGTPDHLPSDAAAETIVEVITGTIDAIPEDYLYVAINSFLINMLGRVGPVYVDPLDRTCATPDLLMVLSSVYSKCRAVQLRAHHTTDDDDIARATLAGEIQKILLKAGIR